MKPENMGSVRRVARQLVDLRDDKRKEMLKTFPTEFKCKIVEEMVNIRLERLRGPDGMIRPGKVSERWGLTKNGHESQTVSSLQRGRKTNPLEATQETFIQMVRRFILTSYRSVIRLAMEKRLYEITQQGEVTASCLRQPHAMLGYCGIFADIRRLSYDNSRYFFLGVSVDLLWKVLNL